MPTIDPRDDAYTAPGVPQPDGRTIGVLLSHGFTGTPSSMRPWAEFLNQHGYAVSVPRLPGHGTSWQQMNTTTYADWYAEIERSFEKLRSECDVVFVAGLSMGGLLVLNLALEHPRDVAGIALVNPMVNSTRKDIKLLPVLKHLVPAFPGIGSDIKKAGVEERAYSKTPLKAAHSLFSSTKAVRDRLPEITQPLMLFRSRIDKVVDPSSGEIIMSTVSSRDLTERVLEDSYHVATMDNDAPAIFEESLEFFRRLSSRG